MQILEMSMTAVIPLNNELVSEELDSCMYDFPWVTTAKCLTLRWVIHLILICTIDH